ncbi:conserved hypothetical protein [Candidatus Terasakiella magnetica]|nr:conserved hypothetical protein [Candidatus Terasakiella magnetica]
MRLSTVLKIAAAAILAMVVGLIAAAKSIDTERYKHLLADRVKAATGLALTFDGPIKLKLGTSPQVSVTGLALQGAKGQMILSVDRIEAQVALMPLIFRTFQVDRLILIRPKLRPEGLTLPAPGGKAPTLNLGQSDESGAPSTSFSLSELRIEDATITVRRGAKAEETQILLSRARVEPESSGGGSVSIKAEGRFGTTPFDVGGLVAAPAALLAGKSSQVQIKANVNGAAVVGRGSVTDPFGTRTVELDLHAQGDELTELLTLITGEKQPTALGPYKLAGKLNETVGGLSLSGLDAIVGKRDSLLLTAKGTVKSLNTASGLDLVVTAEADTLSGVARLMAVELPIAGPLKLSARFNDIEGGWRLTGIKSSLGRSDFAGELALVKAPRPRFFGRLSSTTLVPADFSWPTSGRGSEQARSAPLLPAIVVADGRILSLDPLPVETLKSLDADITMTAQHLPIGAIALTEASADIHLAAGKLAAEGFAAQIGNGRVQGEFRFDGTARTPTFSVRLSGAGLDLAKLAAPGTAPRIASGRGDLTVELKGQGASIRALAGALEGSVTVSMIEAALARPAESDLPLKLLTHLDPAAPAAEPLRLHCAVLKAPIKAGLISLDRGLAVETARSASLGSGSIDLRTETLDLVFSSKGGGTTRLRGTLGAPAVSTETGRASADATPCRTAQARKITR